MLRITAMIMALLTLCACANAQELQMEFALQDGRILDIRNDTEIPMARIEIASGGFPEMALELTGYGVDADGVDFVEFCEGCGESVFIEAFNWGSTYGAFKAVIAWSDGEAWFLTPLHLDQPFLDDPDGDGYHEIYADDGEGVVGFGFYQGGLAAF